MTFLVSLFRGALLLALLTLLSGCLPTGQSQLDEEKEPHFMEGKSRVSSMDYKGAVESFQKALEVNPQSAAAHFELACLFEQREADPAAAIYHYSRYLKLRPEAANADLVKDHIMRCKQELARTVSLGPVSEKVQRELERLTEQNKRLNEENKQLRENLEKWRAYASRLQSLTNPPGTFVPDRASQPLTARRASSGDAGAAGTRGQALASRTHTVKAGETLASIAREYGLRLEALLAANPRLNPRRMQVGQAVNLPAH